MRSSALTVLNSPRTCRPEPVLTRDRTLHSLRKVTPKRENRSPVSHLSRETQPHLLRLPAETAFSPQLFPRLCLSRACLGKSSFSSIKQHRFKTRRFPHLCSSLTTTRRTYAPRYHAWIRSAAPARSALRFCLRCTAVRKNASSLFLSAFPMSVPSLSW